MIEDKVNDGDLEGILILGDLTLPHMRGGHYGPPYYLIVNNFFSQHVIDPGF